MNLFKKHKSSISLFLLVSLFYVFFAFQTEHFSSDDAYFHLRQVEKIHDSGRNIVNDPLSYGGREILYPPLFHYFLAFFAIFFPITFVLKIVPAALLGLLAVLSYLIAREITHHEQASFFAALLTGFIPLLVSQTLNQVSVYSLILPLVFYMIYCFIKMKENRTYVGRFVFLSFLLPFVHPSAFLLVLVLAFYILLIISESLSIDNLRKEAIIFCGILLILLEFLFYRNALLEHGFALFQGGIPSLLLPFYFQDVNIFLILYHLGILTIVLGCFGIFRALYRERNKNAFLLVSVVLSTLLLLLFKFIDFFGGMLFFGVAIGILSSIAFAHFFNYVSITKFAPYQTYVRVFVFVFIIAFSFVPSFFVAQKIIDTSLSDKEEAVFEWIRDSTPRNSVVLADVNEGHYITSIAQRKNVLDSHFLLASKPLERLEDMKLMYLTWSEARALSLFRKYDINYIYLSKRTKQKYNFDSLVYTKNQRCFKKVQSNEKAELYQILC